MNVESTIKWIIISCGKMDEMEDAAKEYPDLQGVTNSTDLLYDTLKNRLKIPTNNILYIHDACHDKIEKDLLNFLKNVDKDNDVLIINYCGHGRLYKDQNLLWVCKDSKDDNLKTFIWFSWLKVRVKIFNKVVFILDCCHSAAVISMGKNGDSPIRYKGVSD